MSKYLKKKKKASVCIGNEVSEFILRVGFIPLPSSQFVLLSQHLVLILIKYVSKAVVGFSFMSGMCMSIIGRWYIKWGILKFAAPKEKKIK